MKTIALLLCVCFTHFSSAQGTMEFRAGLGTGSAHFNLTPDGQFYGEAHFLVDFGYGGANITDAQRTLIRPASWFGLGPNAPPGHNGPFEFIAATWEPGQL